MNETIALPENAIVINGLTAGDNTDRVKFTLTQKWTVEDAGLAIRSDADSCIIKGNVTFGDSEDVDGECVEGLAGVTVVVFVDEEFEPDECEACSVDDLSEIGGDYEFCAYRIEIPCEPVAIECGEPSAAPSGSFYPSSAPSVTPTSSSKPSSSPTETSSASPTASPTSDPTSNPTDVPSSAPSARSHPSSSPSNAPTKGVEEVFPPPSAAPTKCPPSNPILISSEGETMYPSLPIVITSQNTTHVAFKVENTFDGAVSSIFTQYHAGKFGSTECLEEENVDKNSVIEFEFVAQCMFHTKVSVVNIWVTDCGGGDEGAPSFLDESDNAEVPECCHPGEKQCRTVEYTFKLPCVSPCPEDDEAVTLPSTGDDTDEAAKEAPNRPAKEAPGPRNLTAAAKNGNEEASAGEFGADQHFCVVEDYPCGPNNDKVLACHYSARDGYKTFCVPEEDSDALRYYPKDYCGPCVGGYAREE